MLAYQIRMDGNVPEGAVVFIGDSLTQGLCTDAVFVPSVNYGIGGDSTMGVLARLRHYDSLNHAAAIVLAIGVNDIKFRDTRQTVENYARILAALPDRTPILCSAVLPVDETAHHSRSNAVIRDLNVALQELCAKDPRCAFVNAGSALADATGNLAASLHVGDGVHLNCEGNRIWIDELRKAVQLALQV